MRGRCGLLPPLFLSCLTGQGLRVGLFNKLLPPTLSLEYSQGVWHLDYPPFFSSWLIGIPGWLGCQALIGFVMAPKKGMGNKKGKQPLKKAPAKRPAPVPSDSDDEGGMEDQWVILEQLAALEKAQGLSPGGPVRQPPRKVGRVTRQDAFKYF